MRSNLSRALNKAERNYSTIEKECLAVLFALHQFKPYLLCRKFTLVSDHEPLNWMHTRKDPAQRLMRWMFRFTGYEHTFKYKPDKLNKNADALSRNPPEMTEKKINENLPKIKVMIIDEKTKQSGNKTKSNASTDATTFQNRAHSAYERTTAPRGRGRPVGAKTNKNAPKLDHSVIAQRTRGRTTKVESPIATYIKQGAIPKVPKTVKSTKINKPMDKPLLKVTKPTPETIAISEEESIKDTQSKTDSEASTSEKLSPSSRSWLSSTALEGSETERPPLLDPRYSGLRTEDYQSEDPDSDGDTSSTDSQNRTIRNIDKEEVEEASKKFEESLKRYQEKSIIPEKEEIDSEQELITDLPLCLSQEEEITEQMRFRIHELNPHYGTELMD
ncbi:hypothetical protein TSAR_008606 [Trichomalopsis sarcophagae]|uniref:Reverse transcriptase RNase H-like domain-containing protein n=1 Tax=Trichomalopsis sarcophagae TaxID=543379 RepID=A0A232FAB6_9HYME|nr:hypothetical protein TSAR_008606 [Trichomalopsis sarcophagae]